MAAKPKDQGRGTSLDRVYINYLIPRDLRDKLKASAALSGLNVEEHLIHILADAVGHLELASRRESVAV